MRHKKRAISRGLGGCSATRSSQARQGTLCSPSPSCTWPRHVTILASRLALLFAAVLLFMLQTILASSSWSRCAVRLHTAALFLPSRAGRRPNALASLLNRCRHHIACFAPRPLIHQLSAYPSQLCSLAEPIRLHLLRNWPASSFQCSSRAKPTLYRTS